MQRRQVTYSSHPNHRARAVHAQGERQFRTYDTSHIRPRQSKGPAIFAIALALIVVIGAGIGITVAIKGCSGSVDGTAVVVQTDTTVIIPQGLTAKDVADILVSSSIVLDGDDFLKCAKDRGLENKFKPGTYMFTGGMTLNQVIDAIVAGPVALGNLTVPEGLTVEQVAQRVQDASQGAISADEFMECASRASDYAGDFPFVADAYNDSLEGFLFPKTYEVKATDTADSVIRSMLTQYKTEVGGLKISYDQLIIASMIEREVRVDDERPLVASVIMNRLESDMPLGIDATTAYLYGPNFTPDQLHEPGPYNTYDQIGLPAGPICSPGLASIQAAANPASTTYLYYVATGDDKGTHVFSETYEEHLNNIG